MAQVSIWKGILRQEGGGRARHKMPTLGWNSPQIGRVSGGLADRRESWMVMILSPGTLFHSLGKTFATRVPRSVRGARSDPGTSNVGQDILEGRDLR